MANLYVDRRHAQLDYDADTIVVRVDGERVGTVPLAPVERVILRGGSATLTTRLLGRLWQNGTGLLVLSGLASAPTACLPSRQAGDLAIRLAQYDLCRDEAARAGFANRLVIGKLRAQDRVLAEAEAAAPALAVHDARLALARALARLEVPPAPPRTSLRGIEGAASAAYFKGYVTLFAPGLGFAGRNRRPPCDPVNACLSLGYTLLHAEAVREAACAGLDPWLGFYHDPDPGRESLACDLAEPCRPFIDRWVWQMFRQRELRPEHFGAHPKQGCRLHKAARRGFYKAYEEMAPPLRRLLRRACRRLVDALRAGSSVRQLPPSAGGAGA